MTNNIASVTKQIHRKKSHLWKIDRANEGHPHWSYALKDPFKRNETARRLRIEIELLEAHRQNLKNTTPKEIWYPGYKRSGRSKGERNRPKSIVYVCSNGETVTQAEIDKRRGEAYRLKYQDNPCPIDEGFREQRAQCTAHIISQQRCKQIHKTELIWDIENMFAATHESNRAIENPKGQEWKKLKNLQYCLNFIEKHDPELYAKFELSAGNQQNPVI